MKIAVLGGGISGVILARLLQDKGHEPYIFESEEKLGGLCRSKIVDKFVYDLSGSHMISSENEMALDFIFKQTGKENWLPKKCNDAVLFKNKFVKYPFELGLSSLPKEDAYECILSFINTQYEVKYRTKADSKNFYDLVISKYGRAVANHFMIPYYQKKLNYNLKYINTDWIGSDIRPAPLEDVIKSTIGIPVDGCYPEKTFYYPASGGIQFLVDSLSAPLENLYLSTPVNNIEKRDDKWVINQSYEFDDIVSTLALHELLSIIKNTPPFVSSTMESLWYNGMATIFIALNKPFDHDLTRLFIPHRDDSMANTVTFLSNYSNTNTPAGSASLVAEVTYKAKTLPGKEETLVEDIVNSLHKSGVIDKGDIKFTDNTFFRYAYPVYGLKFNEFNQIINNYLNEIKLKRFGRFATHSNYNVDVIIEKALKFVDNSY